MDENGDIVPEGTAGGGTGGDGTAGGTGTSGTTEEIPYEHSIYYYHGDHLGSSSIISDRKGRAYEHVEYFPYGETWANEHRNQTNIPYKFTGKELDPETGLYYFGARYYEPRVSVWISTDPALATYLPSLNKEENRNLPGLGGIFNTSNLNLFSYAVNNPVKYIDPDGNKITVQGTANYKSKILQLLQNLTDDKLSFSKDKTTIIIKSLGSGSKKSGTALIRDLNKKDGTTVNILHKSGQTSENASSFADGLKKGATAGTITGTGKGTDSEIGFDLSVNRTTGSSTVPKEVVLGHELIHSYHDKHGNTEGRGTGTVPDWENQAVGLGTFSTGKITENSIRKEQGITPRTSY